MSKKNNNAVAKAKYIPCDIFKRGIGVFIGTLEQFKKWVSIDYTSDDEKAFIEMILNLEENDVGIASFNYDYKNGNGIVLLPKFPKTPKEIAALAHEMMHATFFIMDFCQVDYNKNTNNETFTYVHEHLMRNALEETGYEEVRNEAQ